MNTKISLRKVFTVVAFSLSISVYAGFWDWSTPYQGPDKDIITLVITGNYTQPRLIADLIQYEKRQPYILLPSSSDGRIFFCPARRKPALEINAENLKRFIKFCNPRQIVVLGDKKFVPEKYLNMIDSQQTVYIISNQNWKKAAESLGKLLNAPNLSDDYPRLSREIESGQLYVPDRQNNSMVPLTRNVDIIEDDIVIDNSGGVEIDTAPLDLEPVTLEPVETTGTEPVAIELIPADVAPEMGADLQEPEIIVPNDDPILIDEMEK